MHYQTPLAMRENITYGWRKRKVKVEMCALYYVDLSNFFKRVHRITKPNKSLFCPLLAEVAQLPFFNILSKDFVNSRLPFVFKYYIEFKSVMLKLGEKLLPSLFMAKIVAEFKYVTLIIGILVLKIDALGFYHKDLAIIIVPF